MATQKSQIDQAWLELVFISQQDREDQIRTRYMALAAHSPQDRVGALLPMARAEFALQEDKLRVFMQSAIKVLLSLPDEAAKSIVSGYNAAVGQLPQDLSIRRVKIVQTLTYALAPAENAKVRLLMPDIFLVEQDATSVSKPAMPPMPTKAPAEQPKRKGRWPF